MIGPSVPGELPNKPPIAGAGVAPNAGAGAGWPNAGAERSHQER